MAIGNIAHAATLLIANLSGTDVAVDVFLGMKGAPGDGKADANSHFIVSSTGDVIAQFAVDEGKKGTLTEATLAPLDLSR